MQRWCEALGELFERDQLGRIPRVILIFNALQMVRGSPNKGTNPPPGILYVDDIFRGSSFNLVAPKLVLGSLSIGTILKFLEQGNLSLVIHPRVREEELDISAITQLFILLVLFKRIFAKEPTDLSSSEAVLNLLIKGTSNLQSRLKFSIAEWADAVLQGNIRFFNEFGDQGKQLESNLYFIRKMEDYRLRMLLPKLKEIASRGKKRLPQDNELLKRTLPTSIFSLIDFISDPSIAEGNIQILAMFGADIPKSWFIESFTGALLASMQHCLQLMDQQISSVLLNHLFLFECWARRNPEGQGSRATARRASEAISKILIKSLEAPNVHSDLLVPASTCLLIFSVSFPEHHDSVLEQLFLAFKLGLLAKIPLTSAKDLFVALSYYLSLQTDKQRFVRMMNPILTENQQISFEVAVSLFQLFPSVGYSLLKAGSKGAVGPLLQLSKEDERRVKGWYSAATTICHELLSQPSNPRQKYACLIAACGLLSDFLDPELPKARLDSTSRRLCKDLTKLSGKIALGLLKDGDLSDDQADSLVFLYGRCFGACGWMDLPDSDPKAVSEFLMTTFFTSPRLFDFSFTRFSFGGAQNSPEKEPFHNFLRARTQENILFTQASSISRAIAENIDAIQDLQFVMEMASRLMLFALDLNGSWKGFVRESQYEIKVGAQTKELMALFFKTLFLAFLMVINSLIPKLLPPSSSPLTEPQQDILVDIYETLSHVHFVALAFGPTGPTEYDRFLEKIFDLFKALPTASTLLSQSLASSFAEEPKDAPQLIFAFKAIESAGFCFTLEDLEEHLFPKFVWIFESKHRQLTPSAQFCLHQLFAKNKHSHIFVPYYAGLLIKASEEDFEFTSIGYPGLIEALSKSNEVLAVFALRLFFNQLNQLLAAIQGTLPSSSPDQKGKEKAKESPQRREGTLENAELMLGRGSSLHLTMMAGRLFELATKFIQCSSLRVLQVLLPELERLFKEQHQLLPINTPIQALYQQVSTNNDYTTRATVLSWYFNLIEGLIDLGVVSGDWSYEIPRPQRGRDMKVGGSQGNSPQVLSRL